MKGNACSNQPSKHVCICFCNLTCSLPCSPLLQESATGRLCPGSIVASYAAYPYDMHVATLAVKALHAFAMSLAAPPGGRPIVPGCFAGLLQGPGSINEGLRLPFKLTYALNYPEWFAAACELLEAGIR